MYLMTKNYIRDVGWWVGGLVNQYSLIIFTFAFPNCW